MDFNWKVLIFLIFIGVIFWVNFRFKNIIVRSYNYLSQFPKVFLIGIGIIAIVSPMLLKNNSFLNYFRDFLPSEITNKLDIIDNLKEKKIPLPSIIKNPANKILGPTRYRRKVPDQLKKVVAANQQWKCKHCNNVLDAKYEVDHIIALEDNGGNDIYNLQALCRNCHGQKTLSDDIKRKYPGGRL